MDWYYISDFPEASQAAVEVERQRAKRQLEKQRVQLPWLGRSTSADEPRLRTFILRVFLSFAKEGRRLGLDGTWTVEQFKQFAEEFLRQFTIEACFTEGDERVHRWISHYGGVESEVMKLYRASPEWKKYDAYLLSVARAQSKPCTRKPNAQHGAPAKSCAEERKGHDRNLST